MSMKFNALNLIKGGLFMKKGGYQILDLKGVDLSTLNAEMDISRYETLQNAHEKPILVSGIVIDGVKQNDVFVTPVFDEDSSLWIFELYGYVIQIYDDGDMSANKEEKIIELESPYTIQVADVSTLVSGELVSTILTASNMGLDIDFTKIKRVYSDSRGAWYYPVESTDSMIRIINTDSLTDGESVDIVELY